MASCGIWMDLKIDILSEVKSGREGERASSLEKTLMLGRIGSRRKRGQQRMRWLD